MNKDVNYYTYEVGKGKWKSPVSLEWNVFKYNFNTNTIEVVNVFDHCSFMSQLYKLKKETDFNKFSDEVRNWLMYYYWSKSEHEVIITSWPPYVTKEEIDRLNKEDVKYRTYVDLYCDEKIDVYTQVMLNWDKFINYLWNNKNLIKKEK